MNDKFIDGMRNSRLPWRPRTEDKFIEARRKYRIPWMPGGRRKSLTRREEKFPGGEIYKGYEKFPEAEIPTLHPPSGGPWRPRMVDNNQILFWFLTSQK